MMNSDAEVAVIGAGPGGATAAYHLATQGLRVIIFDHSHPREKLCQMTVGQTDVLHCIVVGRFYFPKHSPKVMC